MSIPPYESEIYAIQVYVRSNKETETLSNVRVVTKDLHAADQEPYPKGPNDLHMGTTDHGFECLSCRNRKKFCPGHPGHIQLKFPVYSPLFGKYIRQFAKIFCHRCGHLTATKISKSGTNRLILAETVSLNSSIKYKVCGSCGYKNPHIIPDPSNPLGFIGIYEEENPETRKSDLVERKIYPNQMYDIFCRIKDSDLIKLGKLHPEMEHPRNLIIWNLQVAPNTIRPETKNYGGGRVRSDDLTNLYQSIIAYNDGLPDVIPKDLREIEISIENLQLAVYEAIKGTNQKDKKRMVGYGSKAQSSIASRMPRKYGRLRRNLLGSRSMVTARSFITDDNALEIDQVGVPIKVAKDIQIREVVRSYNKSKLMIYFRNGRDRYPGCTQVEKFKTGKTHAIEFIPDDFELEEGDAILRDVVDGDLVQFNRQPSLLPSNISCNRIVVLPVGDTFRLNVLACPLYNADFDGDAMNLIFAQSTMAICEIGFLSQVEQRFIMFKTSGPSMGLFQDALVGIAKLTRSSVIFSKYEAMQMFGQLKIQPRFTKDTYTGRELVSMILPKINFSAKPRFYEPTYGRILKYDPDDIKVVIRRGILQTGVLDKASVGEGAAGGIFHIIHNEFGPRRALDVMFALQQLTTAYLMREGCTIGIRDMIMPKHIVRTEIFDIISKTIHSANMITQRLDKGAIIPPLGQTLTDFVEDLNLNALQHGDEFLEPVLKYMDLEHNEFYKLVSTGSKGDIGKILGCVSSIGQVTIAGKRIVQQFGLKRSMVYFTRFDNHPKSRGYITNSYISGLDVGEMIFHGMDARYALIQKGLSVSITGEQGRKAIKNLESNIVDNHYRTVKSKNIIQMVYGEDGMDARYVEKVKFPTVGLSTKEFESTYHMKSSTFNSKLNPKKVQEYLDQEFDQLNEDREFFRDLYLSVERQSSIHFNDKKHMPINPERVIANVVSKFNLDKTKPKPIDPIKSIDMVNEFCEQLPFIFMNKMQRQENRQPPVRFVICTYLLQILVRSYLCTSNIVSNNINIEALGVILDKMRAIYTRALVAYGSAVGIIAAQSVSEPMTQMVLDSHHRSGGAGSKTTGIDRLKEIFGAKDTGKPTKKKDATATMELIPRYEHTLDRAGNVDKEKVIKIANHIEMIPFKTFVANWQIFFEKFGEPTHPDYEHEKDMISDFLKKNPLLNPPADLSKWCIRIELLKEKLIFKHMDLETIYHKLRRVHQGVYIVYNAENADKIVMRIYRQTHAMKKGEITIDVVKEFKNKLLDTIVRGIPGIRAAVVNDQQAAQSYITEDGSISTRKVYNIFCTGSNISGILENPYIDPDYIQSDNIKEIERMYGIEAARYAIINEIRENIKNLNHRHYTIYADEMTFLGVVTPIERSGLGARELENIMLRASSEAPIDVLSDSAINSMKDVLSGISAPLIMGKAPKIGSLWNELAIDEKMVTEQTVSVSEFVEELKKDKV